MRALKRVLGTDESLALAGPGERPAWNGKLLGRTETRPGRIMPASSRCQASRWRADGDEGAKSQMISVKRGLW